MRRPNVPSITVGSREYLIASFAQELFDDLIDEVETFVGLVFFHDVHRVCRQRRRAGAGFLATFPDGRGMHRSKFLRQNEVPPASFVRADDIVFCWRFRPNAGCCRQFSAHAKREGSGGRGAEGRQSERRGSESRRGRCGQGRKIKGILT